MEDLKLQVILLVLGIITATLTIIEKILNILDKAETRRKAHPNRQPRKQKRKR